MKFHIHTANIHLKGTVSPISFYIGSRFYFIKSRKIICEYCGPNTASSVFLILIPERPFIIGNFNLGIEVGTIGLLSNLLGKRDIFCPYRVQNRKYKLFLTLHL